MFLRIVIAMLCMALPAVAVGGAGRPLDIEAVLGRAVANAPAVRAAKSNETAALRSAAQATAWRNPTIGIEWGQRLGDPAEGASYGVLWEQVFLFPGKLGRAGALARLDAEAARIEAAEASALAAGEAVRAAYGYVAARDGMDHQSERIDRFKRMRRYLEARPVVSPKKRMEKHVVESRIKLLERGLTDGLAARDAALARLVSLLALGEGERVEPRRLAPGLVPSLARFLADVSSGNPELRRARLLLERARAELAVAGLAQAPDFTVTARAGGEGGRASLGVGFALSLPLWDANRGGRDSAAARVAAAARTLDQRSAETGRLARDAYIEYLAAVSNHRAFPASLLDEVHGRLADADREFENGNIDLLTYLEVETQVQEIHAAHFDALRRLADAYVRLLVLRGALAAADFPGKE